MPMAGRREGTAMNVRTNTSDLHVAGFQPLIAPNELLAELPLGESRAATVRGSREAVRRILAGDDDRLLAVVGPCSVHDPDAAVDYALRLAKRPQNWKTTCAWSCGCTSRSRGPRSAGRV